MRFTDDERAMLSDFRTRLDPRDDARLIAAIDSWLTRDAATGDGAGECDGDEIRPGDLVLATTRDDYHQQTRLVVGYVSECNTEFFDTDTITRYMVKGHDGSVVLADRLEKITPEEHRRLSSDRRLAHAKAGAGAGDATLITRISCRASKPVRESATEDLLADLRNWRSIHLARLGVLFDRAADEIERTRISDAEVDAIEFAWSVMRGHSGSKAERIRAFLDRLRKCPAQEKAALPQKTAP